MGVPSGTRMEIGCHHAEMNVICNAAATGVACAGAWLIVTGEPCVLCAKLIHHAGITRVLIVEGGYAGENGVTYLEKHGVGVATVATRWVLDRPGVAAAIVGARYADHLHDTLAVFGLRLDAEDHARLAPILAAHPGPEGDTYSLERDKAGRHGRIMKYNLNKS
jgi:hypothetical protein